MDKLIVAAANQVLQDTAAQLMEEFGSEEQLLFWLHYNDYRGHQEQGHFLFPFLLLRAFDQQ